MKKHKRPHVRYGVSGGWVSPGIISSVQFGDTTQVNSTPDSGGDMGSDTGVGGGDGGSTS